MNNKGIKHGDITAWATKVLHDGLEAVINSKANRRTPYYILVIIKDGYDGPATKGGDSYLLHGRKRQPTKMETVDLSKKKVVTNRFVILDKAPPIPMIGSSLWRIDNKIGEIKCIYILPQDRPMIPGFTVEHESETVGKSAIGMPIIYGAKG